MFTSDMVVDMLNTMLAKVAETSEEKGRAEQRLIADGNLLFKANDEIRALKERLSRHETVPGHAAPIRPVNGLDLAHKIGAALGAAKRGEKINAIKIIREVTGVGLKEAKDAFEIGYPVAPYEAPAQRW